ncbi:B-cell differentiation antigen CD72-like [Opisthocomus hoazin]|uniref:B-cell differentiation antigen CD72-like n=1 Tax=Opisthocomus hoazin TaxID=30419 RepID=UPI003F53382E
MAQSVVYADLKFATAPPLTDPTSPAVPDEDESPYENVPLGPVPAAPSPGRWPQRWRVPTRLLAASLLLLLLVVATVALGACYWQVTRSLRDTTREHAAEQGRLSQELSAREQSLQQTRVELAWARAELQKAWQDGNSSRLELESLTTNLEHVLEVLGKTEKEMQEVQEKLNNSESTVAILRSCVNTECCPPRWVLYRGKCLFISAEENSWWDSQEDCRRKSAQLLVQGTWLFWTLPHFVQTRGATYWIGAQLSSNTRRSSVWQDGRYYAPECRLLQDGKLKNAKCMQSYQWICEQPPKLSSASKTLLPLLVKA